jgi:hypoxia up-regulated 1
VYKTREEVESDKFGTASTEAERAALNNLLEETGDWLYGEGASAKQGDLEDRLNQLKSLVKPVKTRIYEAAERPAKLESLKNILNTTENYVELMKENIDSVKSASLASESSASASATDTASSNPTEPATGTDDFAGLEDSSSSSSAEATQTLDIPVPTPSYTQEDVDTLGGLRDSVQAWLAEKQAAQDTLALNEDPVLLSADLASREAEITKAFRSILERQFRLQQDSTKSSKTKKSKATKKSKKAKPTRKPVTEDEDIDVIDVKPGEDVEEAIRKHEERKAGGGSSQDEIRFETPERDDAHEL